MFVSTAVAATLVATDVGVTDPAAHVAVIAFRQDDRGVGRQNLRDPDGGGVHDFAGHHLAQDRADAAVARHRQLSRVGLLIAGDVSMWLTLAFPAWVLVVSALILLRAGYIDEHRAALE